MTLADRVVLITGARRIGAAVAEQCARRGAQLALHHNKSVDAAARALEAVRGLGGRAEAFQADLSRRRSAAASLPR